MEMMKRMIACVATGLFLVGVAGIAQAAGRSSGIDFCTEGPGYERDFKEKQIVHTKLRRVDQEGNLYIEGMGTYTLNKGIKTIVPIADKSFDFCTEGFSDVQLKNMKIIKMHSEIVPAAGI